MKKEAESVIIQSDKTLQHLEDIYYIRKIRLTADKNKVLTKDGTHFTCNTIIAEDDIENWYEVDIPEGQD